MKAIINGYDMDSGVDAWAKLYGNPDRKTLRGTRLQLPDGTRYSFESYRHAQVACTAWMAQQSARMLQLVESTMTASDRQKGKDPAKRLKSYLLQEAEAVARAAKMEWCEAHGVQVMGQQHDGIMVAHWPDSLGLGGDALAEQLSMAASAACGYEVQVAASCVGPLPVD
jgi:hypothetical protein